MPKFEPPITSEWGDIYVRGLASVAGNECCQLVIKNGQLVKML